MPRFGQGIPPGSRTLHERIMREAAACDRMKPLPSPPLLWQALSPAQRRALLFLAPGRVLVRCGWTPHFYDAVCATGAWPGLSTVAKAARLDTVQNLFSRGLLDLDGSGHDPERQAVLSDRGRFVLDRGRTGGSDAG